MGEASRRSRARAQILAGEPRCIYCGTRNDGLVSLTIEHMPPISMFRSRDRVSGMEFACCERCNVGTKGADVAAACLSMISRHDEPGDWKIDTMVRLLPALDRFAPGLRTEMVNSSQRQRWLWTPSGLIQPHVEFSADGPIVQAYLSVFAAKLAMALYREHIGAALPIDGAVFTTHYLNSGLGQEQANAALRILPVFGTLEQGRKSSLGQFAYRFNCDDRTIVAALASFHDNFHVLAFATSDPATYSQALSRPGMVRTSPGELVSRLESVLPLNLQTH